VIRKQNLVSTESRDGQSLAIRRRVLSERGPAANPLTVARRNGTSYCSHALRVLTVRFALIYDIVQYSHGIGFRGEGDFQYF